MPSPCACDGCACIRTPRPIAVRTQTRRPLESSTFPHGATCRPTRAVHAKDRTPEAPKALIRTGPKYGPFHERNYLAGTLDLCSQFSQGSFTPDALRKLAILRQRPEGLNKPVSPRRQELSRRLGKKKVAELMQRFEAGESTSSLAKELGVSNSALIRMLRAQGAAIPKRKVTDEDVAAMAREYKAGATVREIEAKHGFSHGAVLRSLHRSGVEMRAKAPRTS